MAARKNAYEEEFREMMAALRETYGVLITGFDSDDTLEVFWWRDQSGEMVHFRSADIYHGSIPATEWDDARNQGGKKCLICPGPIVLVFNSKSNPVTYLRCNRCKIAHKVALGELCVLLT